MMSTTGGKACVNCQFILQPHKWEMWVRAVVIFGSPIIINNMGYTLSIARWKTLLGYVIFCLLSLYVMSVLIPWRAKRKVDL